jgi:ABC-type transporter Mla MlaB component
MADGEAAKTVAVQVDGAARPDLCMVDALARLQLAAQRNGWTVRLVDPGPQLVELIDLAGLRDVLLLEPLRQAEEGKELGVEEVVKP